MLKTTPGTFHQRMSPAGGAGEILPAPPAGVGDGRDCPMLLPVLSMELGGLSKILQAPPAGDIRWWNFPGIVFKISLAPPACDISGRNILRVDAAIRDAEGEGVVVRREVEER